MTNNPVSGSIQFQINKCPFCFQADSLSLSNAILSITPPRNPSELAVLSSASLLMLCTHFQNDVVYYGSCIFSYIPGIALACAACYGVCSSVCCFLYTPPLDSVCPSPLGPFLAVFCFFSHVYSFSALDWVTSLASKF